MARWHLKKQLVLLLAVCVGSSIAASFNATATDQVYVSSLFPTTTFNGVEKNGLAIGNNANGTTFAPIMNFDLSSTVRIARFQL